MFSEDENIDRENNVESNKQTSEKSTTSHNELHKHENMSMSSKSETCKNSSESVNSKIAFTTSQSIEQETMNNQLKVIDPNNPLMGRFQNALKLLLLKQRDKLKLEVQSLETSIRSKQNEKSSSVHDKLIRRIKTKRDSLNEFNQMNTELKKTKELVETWINIGKQRYTEILTKTSIQTKKIADLKRQFDCSRQFLSELKKYEKKQVITLNTCNLKISQTQHYKKKLLNDQQKQDLLLLSLTQENSRLEDRIKQLGEQAETKYNERELLKQKVMDSSTDLDSINSGNTKITSLWNEVLINTQQSDKFYQNTKKDLQGAQKKFIALRMEAISHKQNAENEFKKNFDFLNQLEKLKRDKNNLQNSFNTSLDKFNGLKDDFSKIIQITEFQHHNLNQVIIDQNSLKIEINSLLLKKGERTNDKLRYEEEILVELKKQLSSNKNCIQINKKISGLKVQNKDNDLMLAEIENNLKQDLLKLEQYRITSSNLEKDIEENTKSIKNQELALSAINLELKNLHRDDQLKSKQIDQENKKLEILKTKLNEGYIMTPQIKLDQVKHTIDEVQKETNIMKQTWVQKQQQNLQLLDKRNKQYYKLNKGRNHISKEDTKNVKLEQKIVSLSKEVDHHKRTLRKMRNEILKFNENFLQNKGKSSQFWSENEWIQCSYLAELKENEKQILEYTDRLKLLKNELNEIKYVYIEKQRESKSWDTKIQLLVKMKNEIRNKKGDVGEIDTMKKEIHRIQIKEKKLKKILEKIMLDLEASLSRREKVYNTAANKDSRLKEKNKAKQISLKKIENLRNDTKKIKIECNKLDRNINYLLKNKMESECKLTYLIDQLVLVKKNVDDLTKIIEDTGFTKIKNLHNLIYKQDHSKYLNEIKERKYRLLIKDESKINEVFAVESKKTLDLISIVEDLKNNFPHLNIQITLMLYMLKSNDS